MSMTSLDVSSLGLGKDVVSRQQFFITMSIFHPSPASPNLDELFQSTRLHAHGLLESSRRSVDSLLPCK
jgi:hypothetical protein